ncbi:hypothetical protein ScalyP_jg869 [Parmales sp. scaly parma]|nr:hypothetical protein ScalyP_jg869 [Parmales sp. scaly parma]
MFLRLLLLLLLLLLLPFNLVSSYLPASSPTTNIATKLYNGLSLANSRLSIAPKSQIVSPSVHPLHLSIKPCPTKRWLNRLSPNKSNGENLLYVNGTKITRSPMNFDPNSNSKSKSNPNSNPNSNSNSYTIEFSAEITTPSPGYLSIINSSLYSSSFSLQPKKFGSVRKYSLDDGEAKEVRSSSNKSKSKSKRGKKQNQNQNQNWVWPNKVSPTPRGNLLITDGFFVPSKSAGSISILDEETGEVEYVTGGAAGASSRSSYELDELHFDFDDDYQPDFYYHHAVFLDQLPGRSSDILAARASGLGSGELVWFERDVNSGNGNGNGWTEHVLCKGPDVEFTIVDMDPKDGCIEVVAAEFFSRRVSLTSLRVEGEGGLEVVFRRYLDADCGNAYGVAVMPKIYCGGKDEHDEEETPTTPTKNVILDGPFRGKEFDSIIVSNHEDFKNSDNDDSDAADRPGGNLFSFSVPNQAGDWKVDEWTKKVIAGGFRVKSRLSINPGAPGFPYLFYPEERHLLSSNLKSRPYIALAGDGAEAAYIYRPVPAAAAAAATATETETETSELNYELMAEIECGATVGSLAISHGLFCGKGREGFANVFIACYETNFVQVISLNKLD